MRAASALKSIMARTSAIAVTETAESSSICNVKEYAPCPSRRSFPAVWMRAGTSKGLFIQQKDLPSSMHLWDKILLSAMGSSDGNSRQIDGVGGATSTTSKVAIVAKSVRPNIDVDYTFIQVVPDQARLDMTGNCGNIASGVGPFALDEGIFTPQPGKDKVNGILVSRETQLTGPSQIEIRIFNTNTQQTLMETIHVAPDGTFQEAGDCHIPGVEGTSSPIKVSFIKPGGSMTGHMFPSGKTKESLTVQSRIMGKFTVRVSLVDASNPFVLVETRSLNLKDFPSWPDVQDPDFLGLVEDIRRQGAVQFGLAKDVDTAGLVRGTPKIALLSPPDEAHDEADLQVLAFTLGKPHASLQLTGAVCIGAAMAIHGTVAWDLANSKRNTPPKHGMVVEGYEMAAPLPVGIRHPAGVIHAETVLGMDRGGEMEVNQVAVFRTARRLFAGDVFYRL